MPTLFVAHYGHPLLKGLKHWSFLLAVGGENSELYAAYQVTGATNTYEVKEPEVIKPKSSPTFLGKVDVGGIEESRHKEFENLVLAVPVVRGNKGWNCQNWIVDGLKVAREKGFDVNTCSVTELQDLLAKTN